MPCLVLDCGGVLSGKDGQRFDGSDIYKQAVPGAYAFCQLFTKAYGYQQLQVLSRVNYPSEDHWVVRFCETMGLPHVSLVKDRWQRGPISQQLGAEAAVDDNSDCLYYISWYCWQSMEASSLHKPLVLFNKEGYRTGQRKPHDSWVRQRVVRTTSWQVVAEIFGCSAEPEKWDALSRLGPPFRPHSKTLVERFWESATSGQALSCAATPSELVAAAGARVAASATSSASRPCEAEVPVVAASATPKKEEEENKRAGRSTRATEKEEEENKGAQRWTTTPAACLTGARRQPHPNRRRQTLGATTRRLSLNLAHCHRQLRWLGCSGRRHVTGCVGAGGCDKDGRGGSVGARRGTWGCEASS